MVELREKIFVTICEAAVGVGPDKLDAAKLADRILAIPEIAEALDAAAAYGAVVSTQLTNKANRP